MAKKSPADSNGDETPSAPVLNSDARKELMKDCSQLMREIQNERAELNDRAGDVRERLREADVNIKAFMDGLKHTSPDADPAAREAYMSGLREMFELANLGWQGDMFTKPGDDASTKPGYLEDPDTDIATAH